MIFSHSERPILGTILLLASFDIALIFLKGIRVDWPGYGTGTALGSAMIALGLIYRRAGREGRLADTMIAAGLFCVFTLVGSVFNYMFLPIYFPRIDDFLVGVDAAFGYDWPNFVAFFARWPALSTLLKIIYFTSLVQFVIIILVLGFTGRSERLSQFVLTGVIGAITSIVIWIFFPSFGPSALLDIEGDILKNTGLAVEPAYGRELNGLAAHGVDYLSPDNVLGLIAFPSFHTVMAAMSVTFTWQILWLRVPMVCLNFLMVPALLMHGGHHLSDFFGGLLTFVFAYFVGERIINVRRDDRAA